jgi:hypothetical protein
LRPFLTPLLQRIFSGAARAQLDTKNPGEF